MSARIHIIIAADDANLRELPALFTAMHEEMATQGMMLRLAPDGARLWLDGVVNGLDRFNRLVIALDGERTIGFAHGAMKLAPEHLGGARIGLVAHVYVMPAHRRSGVARDLIRWLDEWFALKQVESIELQVVSGNSAGLAFWHSLGYRDELFQLRKR